MTDSGRAPTLRCLRDNAELLALTRPAEPDAIRLVGDARERGVGRHVHAWVVEDDGAALGVVVVARLTPDRWYASPLLFDDAAAPLLAGVVERSRARQLAGPTEHVAPLLPLVPRAQRPGRLPFVVDTEVLPPSALKADARVRLAIKRDLDELLQVYSEFELLRIATRTRLRGYLERTLHERAIVVIDVDGAIAGACSLEFRGIAYDMWSALTVVPADRGEGLYFPLYNMVRKLTRESGRHNCFTLSHLNQVPLERQLQELGHATIVREWTTASLRARRLPGEARLRGVVERLEGRLTPRQPLAGSR